VSVRLACVAALVLAACGPQPPPPVCTDAGAALEACASAPIPDYATLFETVLRPTCGREGPSCHGPGADDRLFFIDEEASRAYLLEHHVVPGSAACSELHQRVTSDDPFFRMPPAEPLPEASRCAIARWIEAGAP
jgi:hypothetical protein